MTFNYHLVAWSLRSVDFSQYLVHMTRFDFPTGLGGARSQSTCDYRAILEDISRKSENCHFQRYEMKTSFSNWAAIVCAIVSSWNVRIRNSVVLFHRTSTCRDIFSQSEGKTPKNTWEICKKSDPTHQKFLRKKKHVFFSFEIAEKNITGVGLLDLVTLRGL